MPRLLVCTRDGLVRLDGEGSSWESVALLEGTAVRCAAATRGRMLVGARDGALLTDVDSAAVDGQSLPVRLL